MKILESNRQYALKCPFISGRYIKKSYLFFKIISEFNLTYCLKILLLSDFHKNSFYVKIHEGLFNS